MEKQEEGGDKKSDVYKKSLGQNDQVIESKTTSEEIAAQLKIGERTVRRAYELTKAIDTIVSNTGVDRMNILAGNIKGSQDEIKELAAMDVESQKRIVELILDEGELSISLASSRLWDENHEKLRIETEERKNQMEAQLKAEREAEAEAERERLKVEHEARMKQEAERLEQEKIEQEKQRLAEIERQKKAAEEKAKNEADLERIRKAAEELKKAERAKAAEQLKQQQELKQKELEEQKRIEEERIKQKQAEKR